MASFWKIEVEVSEELVQMLNKLADRRRTTPPKLINQALQEFFKRNESELSAPVVNTKTAALLRKTAVANKKTPETLIEDFLRLPEDTLLITYKVGPRATKELREYVQNGGR